MAVEGLPNPHDHNLSRLTVSGRGAPVQLLAKVGLCVVSITLGLLFLVSALSPSNLDDQQIHHLQQRLIGLQESWSDSLSGQLDEYRFWLARHGTITEANTFDGVTTILLPFALARSESPNESVLSSVYISALAGLIRLSFLVIASTRLWLSIFIVALFLGARSRRPYVGDDILGQTGNGRLFYSGVRAGLDTVAKSGAPDFLVRGLACPEYASKSETHASLIWKTLQQLHAANPTNESLTAILVRHSDTAAFVPRLEDESRLKEFFLGGGLGEYVPHLLQAALKLHAHYTSGNLQPVIPTRKISGPADAEQYAQAIYSALHRVLTPQLRKAIGALGADEVATLVLALESGKVLAHSSEGGRWFRLSNSPHLSARAVLHSIVSYPSDYGFEAREHLRQAIVYALRASAFAPVRMPVEMGQNAIALRQWAEVLVTLPHQLQESAEEIELFGLVREAHERWRDEVLPKANSLVSDFYTSGYSTSSHVLFLPVVVMVKLLRCTVTDRELSRLSELSAIIGARQGRSPEVTAPPDMSTIASLTQDRVFPPFTDRELSAMSDLHGISEAELQEWSALRNILASNGWFARRVGDYTVPDSSVIYAVFKAPGFDGANSLGFFGRKGLVPLRGGRCKECCGHDWDRRFQVFSAATMAETRDDFENLLRGIKEEVAPDEAGLTLTPA